MDFYMQIEPGLSLTAGIGSRTYMGGDTEVEPPSFTANFERLIIRENEIAFELQGGEPESEDWTVDAVAKLKDGIFSNPLVYMRYTHSEDAPAEVRICFIEISETSCSFQMILRMHDNPRWIWLISGQLDRLEADQEGGTGLA
jgi:hypothetical protein